MDFEESYEEYTGTIEVMVEPGDSIEAIALAFMTTPDAIQAANPGTSIYPLSQQILQIPFPIGQCRGTVYRVRRGDTLASIARQFGVSEEAILRENPFLRILGVRTGFVICIPRPQPEQCPGGFFYTVMAGDTLGSIANRFNTSVGAILRANPGLEPGRLFPGQRICIPSERPPACPGGFFYTVVAGDTLFAIALRFNTTVNAILQANPGLDPNRLFVGQRICIPAVRPPACPGFLYTVVAGDTLNSIANRFNTSVGAILQVNPGLDPNFIVIGQQICIPR
jgi:LysM repeat protein